jgi:TRAP-type C4-dicarboxylate transport system substrate-binding protein
MKKIVLHMGQLSGEGMMSKFSQRAICGFALAAGLAMTQAASAQIALKFGHIVGTDHAIHIGATAMGEHIGKCTNGAVKLDIFPGGQLGNESALIDQTRLGGVDFANTGAGFLSRNYAPLGISSLPYAFRDRDHALAYAKSPVLRELMDNWEKATGQILLGAYYSAAFHVYAQESFEKPEQMRGKKIRVPDAPAWMVFFRAVGANPVPMALGEVYLGLRQGVIDGTNMPLAVGFSTKLHEVSKVINMTYHQMEIAMLVSGPILKGRLNPAQWKCVEEAGKIYAATAEKEIVRSEDALRTEMTQKNMVRFVDVDLAAYRAATASVIADRVKAGELQQSLVDRINAVK